MQPKKDKYAGLMIASIIPGMFAFFSGLFGVVFSIIGNVQMARPQDVSVTINGKQLEGEEAARYAYTLGKILATLGGIALVVAFVLVMICVILAVIYISKSRNADNA